MAFGLLGLTGFPRVCTSFSFEHDGVEMGESAIAQSIGRVFSMEGRGKNSSCNILLILESRLLV